MSAVFSGNTTPCNDFDINAGVLNSALQNAEILNQGQLQLTLIDGTIVINNIPYFVDYIITGILLSQEIVPNLNEINYTSGTYQINAQQYTLALGGSIFCNPSDPTFDRIDLIYLDTLGNINYLAGLAVLNPVVPTLPPNCLKVAEVGVEAGATGSNGYTLTSININSVITSAGFLENQTLRWNSVSGKWVPTSGLLTNTAQQTVIGGIAGFGGMDALTKLQVGGAINIENNSAPFPTTDKLYNIGGTLYWNGIPIGVSNIVAGTSIGNTLYWDGTQWNETDDWTRLQSTVGFTQPFYNYNTTDGTGVKVDLKIGESPSTGARGYELIIDDTLNSNNLSNLISLNGTNGATDFLILQNDFTNDLRSQFLIDTYWMKNEFKLISDPFNGNFSEDTQINWYKRIGSDVTNTTGTYTDIRQEEDIFSIEVNKGVNTNLMLSLTNFNGGLGESSLQLEQTDQANDFNSTIIDDAEILTISKKLISNPLEVTTLQHSYDNWEVNSEGSPTVFSQRSARPTSTEDFVTNATQSGSAFTSPLIHKILFVDGLLTGDSIFDRQGLIIRGNDTLATDVITLKSGGFGNNEFSLLFNGLPIVIVEDDSIYLGRRLYLNRQIIAAGNYIIDSGLLVTNYIITDDTASNTITLPTITGSNSGAIIKIVRQNSTNNFNKQLITLGGATFANTVGLVTYNLANINESVTLQADFTLNTWFVIDSSLPITKITQRNTAISVTVQPTDEMIVVTAAPRTVTLPLAPVNNETHIIKSNGVATGGNPITVAGNGKLIDAAASVNITTANGFLRVVFNTTLNKWLTI